MPPRVLRQLRVSRRVQIQGKTNSVTRLAHRQCGRAAASPLPGKDSVFNLFMEAIATPSRRSFLTLKLCDLPHSGCRVFLASRGRPVPLLGFKHTSGPRTPAPVTILRLHGYLPRSGDTRSEKAVERS